MVRLLNPHSDHSHKLSRTFIFSRRPIRLAGIVANALQRAGESVCWGTTGAGDTEILCRENISIVIAPCVSGAQLVVSAPSESARAFGILLVMLRHVARGHEVCSTRNLPTAVSRRPLESIEGLIERLRSDSDFDARVVFADKVLRDIDSVHFRRPEQVALVLRRNALASIALLRHRGAVSPMQLYRVNLALPCYRSDISQNQSQKFRSDYEGSVDGRLFVGSDHCTLRDGVNVLSIHFAWDVYTGRHVITRLGSHGRTYNDR